MRRQLLPDWIFGLFVSVGIPCLLCGGCVYSHNRALRDNAERHAAYRKIAAKCPGHEWVGVASGGGFLNKGRIEWRCKNCGVPCFD